MRTDPPRTYRVEQLEWDRERGYRNEAVESLDDLVTHHPYANRNAHMVDSVLLGVEAPTRRSHAYVGGEFQEVEMLRTDEYRSLHPDQVLLTKDFILEDPQSARPREVDVPAPIAGYVQRVDARNGLVEIRDRPDGDVVARIRHLSDIAVREGDCTAYGQSLGRQNNVGIAGLRPGQAMHVHLEMDTRYYQHYQDFIGDLVSGRLPVQAEHRQNVQPLQIHDDGTFRLGEFDPRIGDLQRVMAEEGYRSAGGTPLDRDGVYRLSMQGALLDFQRAHGVSQTGDIDPETLRFAPDLAARVGPPPVDHDLPGRQALPRLERPLGPTAPGHPDHPDHRPGLPDPMPAPVNERDGQAFSTGDSELDRLASALFADDDATIFRVSAQIEQSPHVQAFEEWGRDLVAAQQREELQQQELARQMQGPVLRVR